MLQPFLKHAAVVNRQGRGRHKAGQDGPRASASYADALSKLDEAVALADTLGCEVVLKQVRVGLISIPYWCTVPCPTAVVVLYLVHLC